MRALMLAAAMAAPAPVESADHAGVEAYVQPRQRVEVAPGRRLNLVCMGTGERTVLFDAGGSDWSVIWALVQPEVARHARACAYDRAGLGYSDPAPGARTPVDAPLDPDSVTYRRCTDPVRPQLGPAIAAERRRIQVSPAYQKAQASEIVDGVYGDPASEPVYARLFRPGLLGDRPLIVLTHGRFDSEDPLDALGQAQGVALHRQTARLSRRGRQRTIEGSGHNIPLDAPKAVESAVLELLGRD